MAREEEKVRQSGHLDLKKFVEDKLTKNLVGGYLEALTIICPEITELEASSEPDNTIHFGFKLDEFTWEVAYNLFIPDKEQYPIRLLMVYRRPISSMSAVLGKAGEGWERIRLVDYSKGSLDYRSEIHYWVPIFDYGFLGEHHYQNDLVAFTRAEEILEFLKEKFDILKKQWPLTNFQDK